jgi:hypothetical protein
MESMKGRQETERQQGDTPRTQRRPYAPPKLVRFGDMKNVTLGGGCGCGCGTGSILV